MKNTSKRAVRIGTRTIEPGADIPAKLRDIPSVKKMFGGGDEPASTNKTGGDANKQSTDTSNKQATDDKAPKA